MSKILLCFLLSFIVIQSYAVGPGTLFGTNLISPQLRGGGNDLIFTVNNIAGYIIGLFYFIAVMIGIYGGFLVLISGGDEEKVKKGKNYVIYMLYGLIIIFLASTIVMWIINLMSNPKIVGK